uniref:Lipid membrane protein n=1 Tax=Marseillevirus LCMAC201 TaxID=2506605 RepID=A0A481YXH0_9VIRU|nr:MAG: hypothetical protein LCMAC201_04050 [Marseillevirus LCMAC201]
MGNSSSQTLSNYVANTSSYKNTVNESLTNKATTKANVGTSEIASVTVGGEAACCIIPGTKIPITGCTGGRIQCDDFHISQDTKQKTTIITKVSSDTTTDLINNLKTAAKNDIKNKLDQISAGIFAGAFNSSKQDVTDAANNEVDTVLTTNITQNNISEILSNTTGTEKETLYVCGVLTGKDCTLDQKLATNVSVINIATMIGKLAENNTKLNTFYTKVNNTLTQKSVIADFLDKLGMLGIIAVVGGIIFLLIIAAIVVFVMIMKNRKKKSHLPAPTGPAPLIPTSTPVATPQR